MACTCFASPTLLPHHRPNGHLRQKKCRMTMTSPPSPTSNSQTLQDDPTWNPGKVRARRHIRSARGARGLTKARIRIQGYQGRTHYVAPPPTTRITAGTARGRRLETPDVYIRPMMSKVREALFGMLRSLNILHEHHTMLDLYSGTGSVGIEAISRGIGFVTFVDLSQDCIECCETNLKNCGFLERTRIVQSDVLQVLKMEDLNGGQPFRLITVTPPYEEVDYGLLMRSLATSPLVGEGTVVAVEYPVELKSMPPAFENRLVGLRNRRYGRTVLAIYACRPDGDVEPRPHEFIEL